MWNPINQRTSFKTFSFHRFFHEGIDFAYSTQTLYKNLKADIPVSPE